MEKVDESEDRKRGWRGGKKAAWCQVLREGHCDESASSNDAHICYIILPALPGQEFTTTPPPPGTRAGASPDLVPVFFCVLMALHLLPPQSRSLTSDSASVLDQVCRRTEAHAAFKQMVPLG